MIVLNIEDLKLKTIANLPVEVGNLLVKPLTIKEIIQTGYSNYNQALSMIAFKKEQLIKPEYLNDFPDDLGVLNIVFNLFDDEGLKQVFLDSLKLFLKTDDVKFETENGLIVDQKYVDHKMYLEIVNVIKLQNCLVTPEEENYNPINEQADRIRRKMLENKRKIHDLKSEVSKDDILTFSDLISIVCSNANGINLLNVFDLNMYQFNDQFNRMKMLDEYETNIQALLHGADGKSIELKHWMSKMK